MTIRAALETYLATLAPALETAVQNVEFEPPAADVPYQECYLLTAPGRGVGLRQRTTLNRGIFQVNLCYPAGAGAGGAESRGKALQAHFPPNLVIDAGDEGKIRITGQPVVGAEVPGRPGRYVVPVSIRYESTA
jgi:hypothetical protein